MIVKKFALDSSKILAAGEKIAYDWPYTIDMREYDGIGVQVVTEQAQTTPVRLEIALFPLPIGRPEFISVTKASVMIPPKGGYIKVPFSLFDYCHMAEAHMKYISGMELRLDLECKAQVRIPEFGMIRKGELQVKAGKLSVAGNAGEELVYPLTITNGSSKYKYITIGEERYGREILSWSYPHSLMLEPNSSVDITVSAVMRDELPKGGYEEKKLIFLADGELSEEKKIALYAARTQEHPFILHKEEGWEHLKSCIQSDETLRNAFEKEYGIVAEQWQVPEAATTCEYVYQSITQDAFLKTVIAWKLTGRGDYREKLEKYLKGLLDAEKGYLATAHSYFVIVESREEYRKGDFKVHRACDAGWVQEGEFMTKIAIAYDLCCEEPWFTEFMHEQMEQCMRRYMEFEDWRLGDGDGNNFQLSEASAALYFALLLQDEVWIRRFLEGKNGLYDLIGAVYSDDGSYFEGASGYMRLAAEIMGRIAIACEHCGRNLKDMIVPAAYDPDVMHSPWSQRKGKYQKTPFLGMSFERFEQVKKPVRRLKDYYDNLWELLTPEGILFAVNDSNEQRFIAVMEMAYYLYHDPKYLQVVRLAEPGDILFGLHMSEEPTKPLGRESHLNTGNGFAVLRENGKVVTQAVMKYGQHGGYHGHYDRLSLLSYIKDGRNFYNTEYTWYGYDSFLFKMWVQTSIAHNMVVVDGRMQEPTPCECICSQQNEAFSAVCAQTISRWCDPPYGGQTPYLLKFPEEKCAKEGRYILTPQQPRPQGDIGTYSEPVFQRRLLILIDGCCLVWDYEEADTEHTYDCFYHPLGSMDAEQELPELIEKTKRYDENPYGAGQFIMNCQWYQQEKPVKISFHNQRKKINPNDIIDFAADTELYGIYPAAETMMIGRYPQRKDTFQNVEEYQEADMLLSDCRKAVAFRQVGRTARFITALEIGEEAGGSLERIECASYEQVKLYKKDGTCGILCVKGMDCREEKQVKISYQSLS